jgi:uncharacterized protein YjdB
MGACLAAVLMMACGGSGGGTSAPSSPPPAATATLTSITLAPSGPTLNVGAAADLQATGHFSDGTTVTPYDSSVTWASSAPGTASVSASGLVSGVAAGTATITAAKGAIQGSAVVTVNTSTAVLTSITLAPAAGVTLNVGQTSDFTATAHWSNGTSTVPYDSSVTWTTNLPNVATVNSAGVVTAVAAGSATLTASANGLNTTAAITVSSSSPTLTSITLTPASSTLSIGQTVDITSAAKWSNGTSTTPYDSYLTWISSSPSVATVNAGGVVTAVAAGTATITASLGGVSRTAAITVNAGSAAALTGITMLQSTSSLQVGQTTGVVVMANWSNGTTTSPYTTGVTWTSSNSAVATATPNATGCTVTAVSAGTVNITATASGYTATANFGVSGSAPTVDARLVGSWSFVDTIGEYGSFYTFNANGTFTYSLVYINRSGCISHSQIVASHQGTFSTQGSLDNPSSAGQIIFNCTSHYTDYTNCAGSISRYSWNGTNPHFHWAAFINATTLATNHSDDFQATGTLNHTKQ